MRSRCKLERIICRRFARFLNSGNAGLLLGRQRMSILSLSALAVEEFHDIVPPVDYSLISPWLIFASTFVALWLLGVVSWWLARSRKRQLPPKLQRYIALV